MQLMSPHEPLLVTALAQVPLPEVLEADQRLAIERDQWKIVAAVEPLVKQLIADPDHSYIKDKYRRPPERSLEEVPYLVTEVLTRSLPLPIATRGAT